MRTMGIALCLGLGLLAACEQGTEAGSAPSKESSGKPAAATAKPQASAAAVQTAAATGEATAAPSGEASAAPAGSGDAAGAAPGGRSAVPTLDEWNAQTKEVTVRGSSKLNCETKMVREWLRVSCRGKNDS